jgi:hypothetical protein
MTLFEGSTWARSYLSRTRTVRFSHSLASLTVSRWFGSRSKYFVSSKTTSGRIICLSGISSIVMPFGSKCAGGDAAGPHSRPVNPEVPPAKSGQSQSTGCIIGLPVDFVLSGLFQSGRLVAPRLEHKDFALAFLIRHRPLPERKCE